MNRLRYIRDLMLGRLLPEPETADSRSAESSEFFEGDGDRRRFRGMAENRKRQILDRMLLDDGPVPIPIRIELRQGRRR